MSGWPLAKCWTWLATARFGCVTLCGREQTYSTTTRSNFVVKKNIIAHSQVWSSLTKFGCRGLDRWSDLADCGQQFFFFYFAIEFGRRTARSCLWQKDWPNLTSPPRKWIARYGPEVNIGSGWSKSPPSKEDWRCWLDRLICKREQEKYCLFSTLR